MQILRKFISILLNPFIGPVFVVSIALSFLCFMLISNFSSDTNTVILTNSQILMMLALILFIILSLMIHYTIMSMKNNKNNEIKKQKLEQEIENRTIELKNSIKILNQYKLAVDSSAIVSKTDKNGKITFVNDEFIKISKYTKDELIGKNHNIIRHKDMPKEIFKDLWQTLKEKRIWKGEIKNRAKDDSAYYVATTIVPILDINDEIEEYLAIRLNVTKIVEAQLEAKKADEAKSGFLANMSHEIRTPLNAIIGFSDLLSNSKELSISNQKQANIIQTSANSLLSIINDILDISKIESGNFEITMEKTDLYNVSETVVELFSSKATMKHQKLIYDMDNRIPLCVITDSVRIKQILSNLLSNAIKFTPEHGKIRIKLSLLEKDKNESTIRFEVEDSGIGIQQDKIDTIFNPFIQIDNKANREFEGTGLGLSICSHIISSLGSKIQAKSDVGSGSKFWFDLKLQNCEDSITKNKNLCTSLNFKVEDTESKIFHYVKRYLAIFGTINQKDVDCDVIIHCFRDIQDLENKRKTYDNNPILILFEKEFDTINIEKRANEEIISLPFYPSKINDSLQDLLRKTNKCPKQKELDLNNKKFNAKILVAEDNLANQELMKYVLESLGVDVVVRNNGLETLEEYKTNKYDLVLTDINMPLMDGVEAFNQIRIYERENNLSKTPIIAVTANAIKGDKEKFLSLGMDGYISKPINSEELKTIFNIFLSTKELIIEKSENKPSNDNIKIDEVKIANKLGINENIVRLIINKFKSEITKDLEELRDFINRNDIENISQKAHYIKNSCLNVALDEACEILEQLEDKSLEESRKKELFNQLDNQLGNF